MKTASEAISFFAALHNLYLEKVGVAIAYIKKYIEKIGEKIVYSKGLPQFFVSEVMDEDVICPCGIEDKKILLYDDFGCRDEGCYMGEMNRNVIDILPKESPKNFSNCIAFIRTNTHNT